MARVHAQPLTLQEPSPLRCSGPQITPLLLRYPNSYSLSVHEVLTKDVQNYPQGIASFLSTTFREGGIMTILGFQRAILRVREAVRTYSYKWRRQD